MAKTHEVIIELIKINKETDFVDFKEFFYSSEKKHDLIKDVVSFANNINVKNKYIIFGIVNSTGEIKGVEPKSLLDISDIIDFLRMYVEPFVDVELDSFEYQGVTIAYLTILSSNTDRPYVIKKEYQKRSNIYLRQGEIYIRKGASNFIACRADLDEIYANKGTLEVDFYDKKIEVGQLLIGSQKHLIGKVRCVLFNNSSQSIVVDGIKLVMDCTSNSIEYSVDFVDDEKTVFSKQPSLLRSIPLQLESGACIQKTLYFMVSELSVKALYEKISPQHFLNAQICVNSVLGEKYYGDTLPVLMMCTDDLVKNGGKIMLLKEKGDLDMNYSPLRYPGGKSKIAPFISLIIEKINIERCVYVEPFAGGAGVALSLLLNGKVSDIVINDYDKAIYSMWRAMLEDTNRFIDLVRTTPLTIDEWRKQKKIYSNDNQRYSLELGFAAFYLNRTNRSGILSAGPIGGYEQTGKYLIDARYNRDALIGKIQEIAKHKAHIHLYNKDIESFIRTYLPRYQKQAFVYFDPPYYNKGKELYKNFFEHNDHQRIADLICQLPCHWMVTYDDVDEICEMYNGYLCRKFDLNYSLANSGKKSEIMFLSSPTLWPTDDELQKKKIKINLRGK